MPLARTLSFKAYSLVTVVALLLGLLSTSTLVLLAGQRADGNVINIAGRQRMLSQKMTKEALQLLQPGADRQAIRASLEKTAALFDRSLSGLLDGDSGQGLPPPRTRPFVPSWRRLRPSGPPSAPP